MAGLFKYFWFLLSNFNEMILLKDYDISVFESN